MLHTIRLQVRERRRGWRGPTVKQGLAGCKAPTWPVVRARKPNSLALPAGVREPNRSAGCFSASFRSKVRARKPNSLALPTGVREPNQSVSCFSASFRSKVRARKPNSLALPTGVRKPNQSVSCFSASFRSKVRARKPNSLALPAGVREPNQSAGCFSASFRSKVRARKPNSLALPAGVREPNQSAAPGLARSDEGTRACGVQGANMNGRPALFKAHCWRGPTVEQGLAGCKAPTCPVTRGRNRNRKRAAAATLFISLPSSRFIPPKMQFSIGSL